jgi:type IV pilus assembly protein PilQ
LTKVPVLGSLPLVGGLFRQHEQSQTRKNLLIFVTARVLVPARPVT